MGTTFFVTMITRRYFLVTLFIACRILAQAQDLTEDDFTRYTPQDGLSDNHVTDIVQDPYGYIWIATEKGLSRFDGNAFLSFYADSAKNSLPQDRINQLVLFPDGRLGAATYAGLHLINTKTLRQYNITIPPGPLSQQHIESKIYSAAVDSSGAVFLLTATGFYHFNNRDSLVFRYDHYGPEDAGKAIAPFGVTRGIITLAPDTVLLSTNAGWYLYLSAHQSLKHIGQYAGSLFSKLPAEGRFAYHDKHGFCMVASDHLDWFDLDRRVVHQVQIPERIDPHFDFRSVSIPIDDTTRMITSAENGYYLIRNDERNDRYRLLPKLDMPGDHFSAAFLDRDHHLWIGTDRGILCQTKNTADVEKVAIPFAGKSSGPGITSMLVSGDRLFVGTKGYGMYVFDQTDLKRVGHISFSRPNGTDLFNYVYRLIPFGADSLLAGTNENLFAVNPWDYKFHPVSLPHWDFEHAWINNMLVSTEGTIYITTGWTGLFYLRRKGDKRFEIEDDRSSPIFDALQSPYLIAEDPDGNIWFGGHGLTRLNTQTHQFDLQLDSFPKIKTPQTEIDALAIDESGILYFSPTENGLVIYDPVRRTYHHLTRSDGLPDNTLNALCLHGDKLWMGTERGLAFYNINTKHIASLGVQDGMPDGRFTAYAFYYDSIHCKLYGAFDNEIVRFDPDLVQKEKASPSFFIESIELPGSGRIDHPVGGIGLSPLENNLVVSVASIDFDDPREQQFAYRFVSDGNGAWQKMGTQRNIILGKLSPGNYHLQAKVYARNNSWPEVIRDLNFTIRAPYWQKAWFAALLAVFVAAIVAWVWRFRIRRVRQQSEMHIRLADLEMKALHAQMNPHFIFNALNSIKEMILANERKNASRYLSKFAQLIRTTLEQSGRTFVTVGQCVDHLRQYLEMEKIRFDDFTYSITVDENITDDVQMPPMLIQPIVENALWHGLRKMKGKKEVRIRFRQTGEQLVCEIEDNGIGYSASLADKAGKAPMHRSMSIVNIRQRLDVLNEKYNRQGSLTIMDKADLHDQHQTGTLVTLRLALNE